MTQHRVGSAILLLVAVVTLAAPCLSPNRPTDQFRDHLYAPPMRVRLFDDAGRLHAPFVYPLRLVDRLERRYEDDRTRRLSLVWFSGGGVVGVGGCDGIGLREGVGLRVTNRNMHGYIKGVTVRRIPHS